MIYLIYLTEQRWAKTQATIVLECTCRVCVTSFRNEYMYFTF